MSKLELVPQSIFGSEAGTEQIAVFGSLAAGSPEFTTDALAMQSDEFREGWFAAVVAGNSPCVEDTNALHYVTTRQLAYLLQQGIPEFGSTITYYENSFVQSGGDLWKAIWSDPDGFSGQAPAEGSYWTMFGGGGSSSSPTLWGQITGTSPQVAPIGGFSSPLLLNDGDLRWQTDGIANIGSPTDRRPSNIYVKNGVIASQLTARAASGSAKIVITGASGDFGFIPYGGGTDTRVMQLMIGTASGTQELLYLDGTDAASLTVVFSADLANGGSGNSKFLGAYGSSPANGVYPFKGAFLGTRGLGMGYVGGDAIPTFPTAGIYAKIDGILDMGSNGSNRFRDAFLARNLAAGSALAVGVGSPGSSAIFQADSTTRGALLPRGTGSQRDAISSPAQFLLFGNTDLQTEDIHDGDAWRSIETVDIRKLTTNQDSGDLIWSASIGSHEVVRFDAAIVAIAEDADAIATWRYTFSVYRQNGSPAVIIDSAPFDLLGSPRVAGIDGALISPDILTDTNDVQIVVYGLPQAFVLAYLILEDLTYTAVTPGPSAVTIEYEEGIEGNADPVLISVVSNAIKVTSADPLLGPTTAGDINSALNAYEILNPGDLSSLISWAITGTSGDAQTFPVAPTGLAGDSYTDNPVRWKVKVSRVGVEV